MMKNIKNFKKFIKEDATATLGNAGGMGNIVSATPSSTPGDVAGSSIGSGDIGQTLNTFSKSTTNFKRKKKKKKKKTEKDLKKRESFNHEQNKPYDQMYVVKFADYKYTK